MGLAGRRAMFAAVFERIEVHRPTIMKYDLAGSSSVSGRNPPRNRTACRASGLLCRATSVPHRWRNSGEQGGLPGTRMCLCPVGSPIVARRGQRTDRLPKLRISQTARAERDSARRCRRRHPGDRRRPTRNGGVRVDPLRPPSQPRRAAEASCRAAGPPAAGCPGRGQAAEVRANRGNRVYEPITKSAGRRALSA